MKNGRFSILACVRAALGLLLTVGVFTFMQPCARMDGEYGTCHWAGQALAGLGVVLTAQAVTGMLLGNAKAREGVSLSMIPAALLAALIPGAIIPLCMMETMRCNTTMKPAAILIAALIGVLSVGDAILQHNRARRENKE